MKQTWDTLHASLVTIQITMYAQFGNETRSEVVPTVVLDCEDHTNEGWTIVPGELRQVCTEFADALFNTFLKRDKWCQ